VTIDPIVELYYDPFDFGIDDGHRVSRLVPLSGVGYAVTTAAIAAAEPGAPVSYAVNYSYDPLNRPVNVKAAGSPACRRVAGRRIASSSARTRTSSRPTTPPWTRSPSDSPAAACVRPRREARIDRLAEAAAKKWGAEHWYTSTAEALADPDVQIADLCLPHHLHAPVAIEGANAGKHVFVEKPIANTLDEADAMIAACHDNGVLLMVDQTKRYQNRHRKIKELLDAGYVGDPILVRGAYLQDITYAWQHMEPARLKGYWKHDGVISGIGIHALDLQRWLIGEAVEVQAISSTSDMIGAVLRKGTPHARAGGSVTTIQSLSSPRIRWEGPDPVPSPPPAPGRCHSGTPRSAGRGGSRQGGTPLAVCDGARVLGVVHLKDVDGAGRYDVDLAAKRVRIESTHPAREFSAAIEEAGYTPVRAAGG